MTLRDYLSALRRRMWTVAVVCILVAGVAFGVSYVQPSVYEARTRLLLGSSQTTVDSGGFGQYIDPNRIQTELEVLAAKPIADIVQAELGSAPGVSGRAIGGTAVIELTARSNTAQVAADVANAYANAYITYRQKQFADVVANQTREYTRQIEALGAQIASIESRPRPAGSPSPPELDALRSEQSAFRAKLAVVDSAEKLNGSAAAVILPATPAATPVSPTPRRNLILGALVGLVLGIGVALLFEHLDDSLKSKDDVERAFPQLAVLGVIPIIAGWRNRAQPRVVAESDPTSPAAEAYRALRTSIQFLGLDRSLRVIQVTSPVAAEGKSTTIANLAVTLSQAGMRVVVVCCDLRRPRINEFFNVSNDIGFTSVHLGEVPISGALQDAHGTTRVKVLASGPLPPNPSEILSSKRTTDMLRELGNNSDIVLVDCPPVLPVTDAAVLGSKVDGTLLVAAAGSTTVKDLNRAIQLLRQVDAPLLGLVLNGGTEQSAYAYEYRPIEPPSTNGRARKEVRVEKDRKARRSSEDKSRKAS